MALPPDLNDPTALLLAVLKALAAEGIACATYGGLALAAYGTPRETKDADVAVAAHEPARILEALKRAGFDASLAFERAKFGGNLITRASLLPADGQSGLNTADFVEPRSMRLAQAVVSRSMTGAVRGETVRVVTPEDFIVLKLLSTRDRDVEDAAAVLRGVGAAIDLAAIETEVDALVREVSDHDVRGRLTRVKAAAALSA